MKTLITCCALAGALFSAEAATKAVIRTSFGEIELELDEAKAPVTVANFVEYAKSGFYDGTIFHRVIDGFMIQGGGFTKGMQQKQTRPPIKNEAGNGLRNRKYTIAMARTQVVDSATAQFFINVRDNAFLDHRSEDARGFGYAVFGTVTKGADVVDRIARVKTGRVSFFSDVPVEPVVIEKVTVAEKDASPSETSSHTVTVRLTDAEMEMLRKMRGADAAEKLRNAIHDQTGGVFVLCRFDLKPDADRKAYVGRTLDIVPTVRDEKGCRAYTLLEDAKTDWDAPQRFGERTLWMLERWDSIDALRAHLQTPHMREFGPTVRDMREKGTFHVLQEVPRDGH